MDDESLETIMECAQALGCSRSTIYNLLDEGRLRSVRLGRRRMIPRGERRRLVREQLQGAGGQQDPNNALKDKWQHG